ncbi:MAG TPA: peptidoglycan bridge formation glycyltransferase FemA/FemB family protein [Anaerolineales bacterium]|nr:peptidoglycan bridge formation glycyltransferase FemA/FemB family protein [Anaerolineales bacterium]
MTMDRTRWNEIVGSLPDPHLLQSWEWGEVKSQFGWQPFYKFWEDDGQVVAAALILERTINLGGMAARLRMHYTPKGPLLADWSDAALRKRVFDDLIRFGRERAAFLLKVDADVPVGRGVLGEEDAEEGLVGVDVIEMFRREGWRFSNEQVQFRNTMQVDLTVDDDDLLMAMKSKTRYNVRLAGRKGVEVRRGGALDFEMLYNMYAETAVRDGFTIRGKDYYQAVWQTFFEAGMLTPLIAEVEDEPVAGLMLFHFGETAYYLHGMSLDLHRNLMPTYLLQWEAMQAAKEQGCRVYDLWGAPNEFDETDSMWGVYRFKQGFNARELRTIGAWDKPLRPLVFGLYSQVWPRVMGVLRASGKRRTQRTLEGD